MIAKAIAMRLILRYQIGISSFFFASFFAVLAALETDVNSKKTTFSLKSFFIQKKVVYLHPK